MQQKSTSRPLVISELDPDGEPITWDTKPHFRDRKWIEFQWLGPPGAMASQDPYHIDLRARRILKGDDIWTPSDIMETPFWWVQYAEVNKIPGCKMALVETDYPDLYRNPRIYTKKTHWGICLLMEDEEGEYLKIPQSEQELRLAELIRTACHYGMYGCCPGCKDDICVFRGYPSDDSKGEESIEQRVKSRRRAKAYKEEVMNKITGKPPEVVDSVRNDFYRRLELGDFDSYRLDKDELFEISDEIIDAQINGNPFVPQYWLNLRDGYDVPESMWKANIKPLGYPKKVISKISPGD